jgi:hypothetical protein
MATTFKYYILIGFIPAYQTRIRNVFDMIIQPGIFRDRDPKEAAEYYRRNRAKLPTTKKIVQFDTDTSLYFLRHDIDDSIMMIKAKRYIDAVEAFDTLRSLLALYFHTYSEDLELVPLDGKPSFSKLTTKDLTELANTYSPMILKLELYSGMQVPDGQLYVIETQLIKVFSNQSIRRALACFYQSQNIYYTHMVSSYVGVHSRPELIELSSEEYRHNNFLYQEMLHACLIICYRGIEAIYSKNFKTSDFLPGNRRILEGYMDTTLPKTPSRSKYRLRFYRQREERAPKYKLLVNMLEVLFRARNRAAHGYHWQRRHRFETFGSDLVDEAKFFLGHLIAGALE